MRTVTFSDPKVADAVNARLVCTWVNRKPDFHNCSFSTEEWIQKSAPDIYATKNFCTYICTPDRRVVHYFTGYFAPAWFLEELDFVRDVQQQAMNAKGGIDEEILRRLHSARALKRTQQAQDLQKESSSRGARWKSQEEYYRHLARHNFAEGIAYLGKVHALLSSRAPRSLETERDDHLFGNTFTEEKSWRGK